MNSEIYLDANATSPVLPAAIAAAGLAMRDGFGNPSSTHATGLRAKAMLDAVRGRACRLLGVGPGRLAFTSGATEGIQTAVLSALCAVRERRLRGEYAGDLLLYGATEHKAVPESLAHWNRLLGTCLELRAVPVDQMGRHDLDVLRTLAPRAAMVCTMAANNETGAISDLDGIGAVLQAVTSPAYWMVDSVQALGKMHLGLAATRIDYAPFSGHKLYAPKGIGMLYVRAGAPYTPLMCGGGQESGLRAGTENMAGVAALGAVLEALDDGVSFRSPTELSQFRLRLADALREALPGIVFNAPFASTLPTTLNFSVPGFSSRELLDLFDAAGVRVSAGSACSSARSAPSYVLEAMQLPHWRSAAAVRLSFGPMADEKFIDAACARIAHCGDALRATCLIPSAMPVESRDGIVQLGVDGECTWLVLDAASRSCIVIDALAPLAGRIADFIGCQKYKVRAVIDTHAREQCASGRAALLSLLDGQLDGADAGSPLGWPSHSAKATLGNGLRADALVLGERVLACLPDGDDATYLLGARTGDTMLALSDVTFAFTGQTLCPRAVAAIGPQTILCASRESGAVPCTTLATRGSRHGSASIRRQLEAHALEAFLDAHPDALLVDVREAYEHVAARTGTWHGRKTLSVPLSRLADRLPLWLGAAQNPLVFFCRSGGRSARAAECLQRLGYPNAWHVSGGLPLESARRQESIAA
jgi:cysteine sulfinate desulfinase/cysteine desulfurase-like protein/rhodanese-related sulfurtransferase